MKNIKICGFNVSIEHGQLNRSNYYGQFIEEEQKILLKDNISKQLTEETLVHEILHACFAYSGVGKLIEDQVVLNEEQIVRLLSPILYQVFRDNDILDKTTKKK